MMTRWPRKQDRSMFVLIAGERSKEISILCFKFSVDPDSSLGFTPRVLFI